MRRYWRLWIMALLAAFLFSFPAYAGEKAAEPEMIYPTGLEPLPENIPDPRVEEDADGIQPYNGTVPYSGTETELFLELEGKMKTALLEGEPELNVTDMNIDAADYKIYRLVYFSPYLSNGIDLDCYYNPLTNTYTRVEIENPMSLEETKAYCLSIDSDVSEIMQQVSDEMDDETKALRIHDYFVYEYEYDNDNLLADTLPEDSFRSGGIIRNKIGVCQAYAYAYSYIMNKMGLECHVTGSDPMNHAWNILKLNGSYYHVDCTWDDPVYDRLGRVGHEFFLLSDYEILYGRAQGHYGWDLLIDCDDNRYDDYYWTDIISQIILDGSSMYYIKNERDADGRIDHGFIFCQESYGAPRKLKDLGEWTDWDAPDQYYWPGAYSGLFLQDGELYYNTATELRKMSVDGSSDVRICEDVSDTEEGYLYGSRKHGDQLEYTLCTSPQFEEKAARFHVPVPFSIAPSQIILGTDSMKLGVGKSKTISYKLVPAGASSQIQWTSDNTNVAGVDANGEVTGRAEGTAKITALTGNGKTAVCTVNVSREKYKVTFDANGGTVLAETREIELGNTYGTMPVPVRAGYQFAGWFTHSVNGSEKTEGDQVREKDHTLYAHWKANTYLVRYDKNGGSGGSMTDTVCKYGGSVILRPNAYTKPGYHFAGWAETPGGSVAYQDQAIVRNLTTVDGGIKTLYAKWTPARYKITYKLGGGKNNKKNPSGYYITSSKISLKNPTRKGCIFKGWYSDSKYKKKVSAIQAGSTGNKTLYAKWSVKKYKITYKLKGGKNHKKNPKTYQVTRKTISLKKPVRKGYTFKGWYSDSKYKKKVTKIKKGSTGNKVLYARWSRS